MKARVDSDIAISWDSRVAARGGGWHGNGGQRKVQREESGGGTR